MQNRNVSSDPAQVVGMVPSAELPGLEQHARDMALKASDMQVRLEQLQLRQARLPAAERGTLDSDIAKAQHDYTAAVLDRDAARAKVDEAKAQLQAQSLVLPPFVGEVTTTAPYGWPIGRDQLEYAGAAIFLLLFPLSLALARRFWVRSVRVPVPSFPSEDSERLRRLESAMESVAIEVERIGEGQRFATKLLTERRPEAPVIQDAPSKAAARREIGSITPH